ncbi:hypothetical protein Tco_0836924, partial [Tanacetum coccineum]
MTNTLSGMTHAAIEEMINRRVGAALEARRVNRNLELGNGNGNDNGNGNGNGNGNDNKHYRKDCPKIKNQNRRDKARVPDARGRAYVLGGGDINPGSNTVT